MITKERKIGHQSHEQSTLNAVFRVDHSGTITTTALNDETRQNNSKALDKRDNNDDHDKHNNNNTNSNSDTNNDFGDESDDYEEPRLSKKSRLPFKIPQIASAGNLSLSTHGRSTLSRRVPSSSSTPSVSRRGLLRRSYSCRTNSSSSKDLMADETNSKNHSTSTNSSCVAKPSALPRSRSNDGVGSDAAARPLDESYHVHEPLHDFQDDHDHYSEYSSFDDSCASFSSSVTSVSIPPALTNRSSIHGDDVIGYRLRSYGIMPMDRKKTVDANKVKNSPPHVLKAVEEVHRWLFMEGGHFEDAQALLTEYANYIRDNYKIPLDRLFYGGIGLHPKLSAYLWRWEPDSFEHREMPQEIFEKRNEIFSPDEPFCQLEQARAPFVRMRSSDAYIPPDTAKWFRAGNYHDYYALPDIYRGQFKGGIAWSTKKPGGFNLDDIKFFELSLPALTTVMRVHTNDLVMRTLTDRMEKEIEQRTAQLATANQRLAHANAQLAHQQTMQLEHFACMSHEIRTPLHCIIGFSSLLLETEESLDPMQLDTIKMINTSGELLKAVVDDVLDYAKLESGKFEVDIRSIDLQDTLDSVVHSISNKVQDKGIKLRTYYAANLPPRMETDSRRIQQIMYNLLGNAGKFSHKNSFVDFSVSLCTSSTKPTDEAGNKRIAVRFSVKDYGKGIRKKDFIKIFMPFSQATSETQTLYGGTGLGLSITSKLVNRLGGMIALNSELGKFTEFIVELPFVGDLVDFDGIKENLDHVTIVLIRDLERFTNNYSMELNDKSPLGPAVATKYDLTVLRCANWAQLEKKIGLHRLKHKDQHYAVVVQDHQYDATGYRRFQAIVGSNHTSLFTFGKDYRASNNAQHHFKSLDGAIPSLFLTTVGRHIRDHIQELNDNPDEPLSPILSPSTHSLTSPTRGTYPGLAIDPAVPICKDPSKHSNLYPDSSEIITSPLNPVLSNTQKPKRNLFDVPSAPTTPTSSSVSHSKTKSMNCGYDFSILKVLCAEDNLVNQKVFHRMISKLGVKDIDIVENGLRAVNACKAKKYDIVFMDCQMPVMDGLEACKKVVKDDPTAVVVFLTAHALDDFKHQAEGCGGKGFMPKPCSMKTIRESLIRNYPKQVASEESKNNDNEGSEATVPIEIVAHMPPKTPLVPLDEQTPASNNTESKKTTEEKMSRRHSNDLNVTVPAVSDQLQQQQQQQQHEVQQQQQVPQQQQVQQKPKVAPLFALLAPSLAKPPVSTAVVNGKKHHTNNKNTNSSTVKPTQSNNQGTIDFSTLTILYAEDNMVNQKIFHRMITKLGVVNFEMVDNGAKAVDITKTKEYDLIFMDYQMPVMDGLEACKLIMERDPTQLIVFISAHALEEYKSKAKACGGLGFLSKPCSVKIIRETLEKFCGKKGSNDVVARNGSV